MKMKTEHYTYMETKINQYLSKHPHLVHQYETGQFELSDRVHNLQTRFNHDLAYGAGLTGFICDNLYPYLEDRHIKTALKKICPTITKR